MTTTSRRTLLKAIPTVVGAGALAGCTTSSSAEDEPRGLAEGAGSIWDIPPAAWSRALGNHPSGATGALPSFGSRQPPASRTKRGIPLGGIGTGSMMYNLSGSFGPWHLDIGGDDSLGAHWGSSFASGFEDRYLAQGAFFARVQSATLVTTRVLSTEDVLPAWVPLQTGLGRYSALFPKAWFEYEELPIPISLKQLTPFVARDERLSSLPVGLFQLAAANPTDLPVTVTAMLGFPNAIYRLPTQYPYTRTGLRSSVEHEGGVTGVRLQADDKRRNDPVTQQTEWVIAARGPSGSEVSYTEDWAADGDGSDLWEALNLRASLPNGPLDPRRRALGGAVAVTFTVNPNQRKAATFALAWDFPLVQFRNPYEGTRWWKRYTEFYSGPYRAWDIAREAVQTVSHIEKAIDAWWNPVAKGTQYPLWLRTAALNELYFDVFGGVFWENGCVNKPKRLGARDGQHLYFTLEDDDYRDCESFDVRHYEARHMTKLYPAIDKDVLLGWADMIMDDPIGLTPHDAGSPVDDPWFKYNAYSTTRPGKHGAGIDWLDLPAKFVQQCHSYWTYTGDDGFAADVYPAAQRTMTHLMSRDTDGDGIPEDVGFVCTYDDIYVESANLYVGALVVGACEAMSHFARVLDTDIESARWSLAADLARSTIESVLWDQDLGYYRFEVAGSLEKGLMADGLCGALYATNDGLPDVLDKDRMAEHLMSVYERNVKTLMSGYLGAVNLTLPPEANLAEAPRLSAQARAVWPGGSYFAAALMYLVGRSTNRSDLVEAALSTGFGVYRTTYLDDRSAFWFDTPALWLVEGDLFRYRAAQYQRNRAVWELLLAIHDPYPKGWAPK